MAQPSELMDDVIAEILLRVPSDDPGHLVRASLVCKRWFALLTNPNFVRLYRAFHRTPPLLGYLEERKFVPTTSAPFAPTPGFAYALDCHHGRVLLSACDGDNDWYLVVWDPVTGSRTRVPEPGTGDWLISSAAVCCAASGCDHLECHGGSFRLVVMATAQHDHVMLRMYSSEQGAWRTPVRLGNQHVPHLRPRQAAVVDDGVHFTIGRAKLIVRFDTRENCLSMINPPPTKVDRLSISLLEMEDGSLGFAYIQDSSLHLWSRKSSEGAAAAAEWVQCRAVELRKRIPFAVSDDAFAYAYVVGAAKGVGVIFVSTGAGLFTFKIDSGQVKRIGEPDPDYYIILPFMSFYSNPGTVLQC